MSFKEVGAQQKQDTKEDPPSDVPSPAMVAGSRLTSSTAHIVGRLVGSRQIAEG